MFREHKYTVITQDVNGRIFDVYFRKAYPSAENQAVISAAFRILRPYPTPIVDFLIFRLKNSAHGTGSLHVNGSFDLVW